MEVPMALYAIRCGKLQGFPLLRAARVPYKIRRIWVPKLFSNQDGDDVGRHPPDKLFLMLGCFTRSSSGASTKQRSSSHSRGGTQRPGDSCSGDAQSCCSHGCAHGHTKNVVTKISRATGIIFGLVAIEHIDDFCRIDDVVDDNENFAGTDGIIVENGLGFGDAAFGEGLGIGALRRLVIKLNDDLEILFGDAKFAKCFESLVRVLAMSKSSANDLEVIGAGDSFGHKIPLG